MKKRILATVFIAICFFANNSVFALTYYVSLTGNNSNNGLSEATSWRTIGFAASAASSVTAGDTVFIKAGDYGIDDVFIEKNYSNTDARISFIGFQNTPGDITDFPFSYGDEVDASVMPLINPGDRTIGEGINLSDSYSITIKNIQIGNSLAAISIWNTTSIESNHVLENIFIKDIGDDYSTALGITRANGNTVKNCLIVNATGAGMDIWGDNNLIENCQVYSNESEPTPGGTYTSMDYYIVLKGNSNIVRNCYIERDGNLEDVGHGMEIKESGENNLFVDCIAKNMIGGCFSVRWSEVQHNEFRNCKAIGSLEDVCAFLIRDGASYNVFNSCTSEGCPAGVRFLLSGEDEDYCGEHNTFNNCIIKNADWVFDLNSWYYSSATVDSNLFANCVIDSASYLFNCERPNSGNKLVNCIITNVDTFLIGDDPSSFEFLYCDFYNNGFDMLSGTGNIEADPLFANASNGDYHIPKESPCVDTATATDAPDTDFEGTIRPQGNAYDMGAYEYSDLTVIPKIINQKNLLYPNPANDYFTVNNSEKVLKIIIYNQTGQKVFENKGFNNKINVSGLSDGIYYVVLQTNTNRINRKLIIEGN